MDRSQLDGIMNTAHKAISVAGYECIETEWNQHDRILRIFVDHANGVDLSACVEANKLLDERAEFETYLPEGSTLEISSPGIERPLRRLADFGKYVGCQINVHLNMKLEGRRRDFGRLLQVSNDGMIVLDTASGEWAFPHAAILKANLVYEWQN
ncbi:MAG: hypothetical protein R3B45_14090 [Bdellovibrionota bacterium]